MLGISRLGHARANTELRCWEVAHLLSVVLHAAAQTDVVSGLTTASSVATASVIAEAYGVIGIWLDFFQLSITVGKVALVAHDTVTIVLKVSTLLCLIFKVIYLAGVVLIPIVSSSLVAVVHALMHLLLLLLVAAADVVHVVGHILHLLGLVARVLALW